MSSTGGRKLGQGVNKQTGTNPWRIPFASRPSGKGVSASSLWEGGEGKFPLFITRRLPACQHGHCQWQWPWPWPGRRLCYYTPPSPFPPPCENHEGPCPWPSALLYPWFGDPLFIFIHFASGDELLDVDGVRRDRSYARGGRRGVPFGHGGILGRGSLRGQGQAFQGQGYGPRWWRWWQGGGWR